MSEERELLKELSTKDMVSYYYPNLINRIKELLAQPESLTPRQGLAGYTKGYHNGYGVAVRDLKTKIDSVFNLIMEDDDEC